MVVARVGKMSILKGRGLIQEGRGHAATRPLGWVEKFDPRVRNGREKLTGMAGGRGQTRGAEGGQLDVLRLSHTRDAATLHVTGC
eukprot:763362-Hanusia_phi.AAC.5